MAILPVGIRKEMQTQMFRTAQSAPPEPASAYMQGGPSVPPEQPAPVANVAKNIDDQNIRDFVTDILVNRLGVPERTVDKKLENLVSYSIASNGDISGFFIIPVHTGQKKVSLQEAKQIVSDFCSAFNVECEIEHGKNFKISFKSVPKTDIQEPTDEGSLKFVPDEKGTAQKKVASSIFAEQFEMRKTMLADTLKRLGYTK
jgi:hypothetical protein